MEYREPLIVVLFHHSLMANVFTWHQVQIGRDMIHHGSIVSSLDKFLLKYKYNWQSNEESKFSWNHHIKTLILSVEKPVINFKEIDWIFSN